MWIGIWGSNCVGSKCEGRKNRDRTTSATLSGRCECLYRTPPGSNFVTWDPDLYGAFRAPRMRPALDLLARIDPEAPVSVFDLGCGPGEVTREIARRWPGARVTGLDRSPDMLARARDATGAIDWVEGDITKFETAGAGLIFSNAVFNWVPGHDTLFPRLAGMLAPGGILAVQMPRNFAEPSHTSIAEPVRAGPWRTRLEAMLLPPPVAAMADYYDWLSPLTDGIKVWETVYLHRLEGENPVVSWFRATALRPFVEALGGCERDDFLEDYAARVAKAYPARADGITLLPMRRIFVLARART